MEGFAVSAVGGAAEGGSARGLARPLAPALDAAAPLLEDEAPKAPLRSARAALEGGGNFAGSAVGWAADGAVDGASGRGLARALAPVLDDAPLPEEIISAASASSAAATSEDFEDFALAAFVGRELVGARPSPLFRLGDAFRRAESGALGGMAFSKKTPRAPPNAQAGGVAWEELLKFDDGGGRLQLAGHMDVRNAGHM